MEIVDILSMFENVPILVFALVLLNREMKKREEAECREREILRIVAELPAEA